MMSSRVVERVQHNSRTTEWFLTSIMIGFASVLLLPGSTFNTSLNYAGFSWISESALGHVLLIIATARFVALLINGRMKRTTHAIRLAMALAGAVVFSILTLSFGAQIMVSLTFNTAVTTYGACLIFELVIVLRATADLMDAHAR